MKNQFFADERDFLKYDLWMELADYLSKQPRLTFVPMLTGPDGTKQGAKTNYLAGERRKCLYHFLQFCLCDKRRAITELRQFFVSDAGRAYVYHAYLVAVQFPQWNADLAKTDLDSRAERLRQELKRCGIDDWSVYWIAQKKAKTDKVGELAFFVLAPRSGAAEKVENTLSNYAERQGMALSVFS